MTDQYQLTGVLGKGSFAWAFKGVRDGQEVAFKTWPCPGDIDAAGDTAAVREANNRTRQESFVAAVIEEARLRKLNKAVDQEDLGGKLVDGERKRLVEKRPYVAEEVVPISSPGHYIDVADFIDIYNIATIAETARSIPDPYEIPFSMLDQLSRASR
ncbi:unnamed protein product [Vitrella brassicaformis CCMP3155]|uniref:Protein kinase domain-containing protein n=1 Tax=Vitrella brassicaformis (strain CCMP3155) TaxID=1169540 RepID=A0A0G4FME5_VITBC|nr:unnamed protein product [Vitrella brassicaformis CCMP3155]|eukprot:CEM15086.1 unnamed protein product [Vitrella brassicaformis CCMP3155]